MVGANALEKRVIEGSLIPGLAKDALIVTADGYRELLAHAFSHADTSIDHAPLQIPYTGIVCSGYR